MAKQHLRRASKISLERSLLRLRLRLRRGIKKTQKSRLLLLKHRHTKAAMASAPPTPPIEEVPDSPRYEVGNAPDSPVYQVGEYDSSAPNSPVYEVGVYECSPDSPRYEVADYEEQEDPYEGLILDPVWWGCLEIRGATFGCLRAHLTKKACPKAVAAATAMPAEVLCATLTPRLESWPKTFHESPSGPTDDNIGIYLVPSDEFCKEGYDILVNDVMRRDLALTVSYGEYELLIFGSDQLPLAFQQFCGRYYLWGVFRARRSNHS